MSNKAAIIMACYNDGAYLPEALSSALAVRYEPLEIILVDDGSTDPATRIVLEQAKGSDPRLRVIHHPTNLGLPTARNTGIRATEADYLLPLDADNRLRPDYLAKAIALLESKPAVGVVYAFAQYFGEMEGVWEQPEFSLTEMLETNRVDACAVLRRSVWEQAGGYNEEHFTVGWDDWDLWLSALASGWHFHRLPEVLFDYRKRNDSMCSRIVRPENRAPLFAELVRRHEPLYRAHALELLISTHTKLAHAEWDIHQRAVRLQALQHACDLAQFKLAEAQQLHLEIRWFLDWRARIKGWLNR